MQPPPKHPEAPRPAPPPGRLPPIRHDLAMPPAKKPMGSLGRALIVMGIFLVGCFLMGAVSAVLKKIGGSAAPSAAPALSAPATK